MSKPTILGLFGSAGSGKDLVADWLCEKHSFVKIAFADPMKRFAKTAFGLTYLQLWGPSEARNQLFKVDDYWWLNAINNFGRAASEITQYVLYEGNRVQGYLQLYDWLYKLRENHKEEISARIILQTLGTEWGRSVDELMWINYTYATIHNLIDNHLNYTQTGGLELSYKGENDDPNGIVIPDHRFLNEIERTQAKEGYVIKLRRLSLEKKEETIGVAGHVSEAGQKTIPDSAFDCILNLEEGVGKVYNALEEMYEHQLWIDTRKLLL